MKDKTYLIIMSGIILAGLLTILFNLPDKVTTKKCYSYDLMYDTIGMEKIVKTNVEEIRCNK